MISVICVKLNVDLHNALQAKTMAVMKSEQDIARA
jgi:hypothetical protein